MGDWGDEPLRFRTVALERAIARSRPVPPEEHVGEDVPERTVPDLAFGDWARATFIEPGGLLVNDAHEHLVDARIGMLWTNIVNTRGQRRVLGTAEIPRVMGTRWQRARAEQQLRDWFECELDFALTFYAPEVSQLDDASFCALVEHELYHCAQDLDRYGGPRFDRITGRPLYAIRGHDSEEFVGCVERYGIGAMDSGTQRLVAAARRPPAVAASAIAAACGVRVGRAA